MFCWVKLKPTLSHLVCTSAVTISNDHTTQSIYVVKQEWLYLLKCIEELVVNVIISNYYYYALHKVYRLICNDVIAFYINQMDIKCSGFALEIWYFCYILCQIVSASKGNCGCVVKMIYILVALLFKRLWSVENEIVKVNFVNW